MGEAADLSGEEKAVKDKLMGFQYFLTQHGGQPPGQGIPARSAFAMPGPKHVAASGELTCRNSCSQRPMTF